MLRLLLVALALAGGSPGVLGARKPKQLLRFTNGVNFKNGTDMTTLLRSLKTVYKACAKSVTLTKPSYLGVDIGMGSGDRYQVAVILDVKVASDFGKFVQCAYASPVVQPYIANITRWDTAAAYVSSANSKTLKASDMVYMYMYSFPANVSINATVAAVDSIINTVQDDTGDLQNKKRATYGGSMTDVVKSLGLTPRSYYGVLAFPSERKLQGYLDYMKNSTTTAEVQKYTSSTASVQFRPIVFNP